MHRTALHVATSIFNKNGYYRQTIASIATTTIVSQPEPHSQIMYIFYNK